MVHINRIEQLFGVVIIAYTWAYLVGITANLKVKVIRTLNNGRRAISLVKYGLNFIADTLINPFRPTKINVFPDFDSLKIPFFLRSDNQYIVKSADFSG